MEPTTLPIDGGSRMLHIIAGGNEGGIWQMLPLGLGKVMPQPGFSSGVVM